MPEADIRSMLEQIEEKIRSKIDLRHHDALIRLREILENDLIEHRISSSCAEHADDDDKAA
jgi:hypothetical protein